MFQLFAWNNTFQLAVDGDFDDDPAMRKWADWTMARKDEYWARLEDGTIWSWNNLEMGYITLPQPIHQSDILPGMPSDGNWGDWMAAKLVDLCVKTGFRGISMADGFCLLRRPGVRKIDFHPEIMGAFESQTGISLTGTDPERAESILKNHRNAWTDWWARQFAVWFRKLDGPLTLSGNARGFSFFDRNGDLVILVARKDWDDQQAVEEEVTITLSGIEDGTYSLRDAFKDPYDETFALSVTNGQRIGIIPS